MFNNLLKLNLMSLANIRNILPTHKNNSKIYDQRYLI